MERKTVIFCGEEVDERLIHVLIDTVAPSVCCVVEALALRDVGKTEMEKAAQNTALAIVSALKISTT